MSHVKMWAEQADRAVEATLAKHDAAVYASAIADVAAHLRSWWIAERCGESACQMGRSKCYVCEQADALESGSWKGTKP